MRVGASKICKINIEGNVVNGEMWLKNIMKYYKLKNYKSIYLKSSHQKVFYMYSRLGREIGEYMSTSDNELFSRKGKIFKIIL